MTVPSLQASRGWALRERRDATWLRRGLRHCRGDATSQRRAWAGLQRQQRRALAQLPRPRATPADRQAQARYRLQAHYPAHRGFVRPGELDAAVLALARHGVPVDWVHGRFDAICPPGNSRRWAAMGRPCPCSWWPAGTWAQNPPCWALRYCVTAAVGDSD